MPRKKSIKAKPAPETFPQEINVYEDTVYMGYGRAKQKILTIRRDINTLGTARGREVAIYKLVKIVRVTKAVKTEVKVSSDES